MPNQRFRDLIANAEATARDAAHAAEVLAAARLSCYPHQWGPTKYTPIVRKGYEYQDLQGHFTVERDGRINAPYRYAPDRTTDRWTRECVVCGKTEETTHVTEKVTKEPKF